ncbi:MAG: hypothetical protein IKO41_21380 [Lachnospiraceae bacterium]|nr:hypothetical protein [Lachnospiraceae bacterium]
MFFEYDRVLACNGVGDIWVPTLFSYYSGGGETLRYHTVSGVFKYCIGYDEHSDLAGKPCTEDFGLRLSEYKSGVFKPGDLVSVSDDGVNWVDAKFVKSVSRRSKSHFSVLYYVELLTDPYGVVTKWSKCMSR